MLNLGEGEAVVFDEFLRCGVAAAGGVEERELEEMSGLGFLYWGL